jgi:hypothetical protein
VQLGSHVPNARVLVSMAPDVRAIMGVQDMWEGSIINVCKTCEHAAIVQLQCNIVPVDHSPDTTIVQSDPTAR